MSKESEELVISRLVIFYKLFLGVIETLLGLGIIFFGDQVLDIYQRFMNDEILEDPHDLLVFIVQHTVPFIFEHQGSVVLFLLLIGLVKVIGAIGLFYRKHWGLDLLILLTIGLLPFQTFNLVVHTSIYKLIFFLINFFIALYLVQFKPKDYFLGFHKRVKNNF